MATPQFPELKQLFIEGARGLPDVVEKRMFGCEGFFREKAVFGLIWKTGRIGVKLPDPAAFEEAMALPGAAPWTAGAMAMSHWVLVPESMHGDKRALAGWIGRAHALAGEAPAKPAGKRAASKPAAASSKRPAPKSSAGASAKKKASPKS